MNRLTTMRAAAAALLLAGVQFAHAHAFPTHQAPSAGETVTASPPRVAIDFDDGLEPAFSSIAVTDAQGRAVTNGKGEVDASNRKHMSVALNPLAPGVYTVAWVARPTHTAPRLRMAGARRTASRRVRTGSSPPLRAAGRCRAGTAFRCSTRTARSAG